MDLKQLILTVGYLGIFGIVFAESGLFIGFFLPGDSLLFTSGFLASQHILDIRWLLPICFMAAVLGDSVGYWFGKRFGRSFFQKKDRFFFHKRNLERAENFYKIHGRKTIVIARFTPIIRTFAPIVAGIGDMHYKTFVAFNVIGGFLWVIGLCLAGYFLGNMIPGVDKYLLSIVAVIVFLSILPGTIHFLKDENIRNDIKSKLRRKK